MKPKYIPALVTLVAGAITAILNILRGADNMYALKSLFFTLVIFFIIGQIAKGVLNSVLVKETEEEELEDEEEETKGEEIEKEAVNESNA